MTMKAKQLGPYVWVINTTPGKPGRRIYGEFATSDEALKFAAERDYGQFEIGAALRDKRERREG